LGKERKQGERREGSQSYGKMAKKNVLARGERRKPDLKTNGALEPRKEKKEEKEEKKAVCLAVCLTLPWRGAKGRISPTPLPPPPGHLFSPSYTNEPIPTGAKRE